MKPIIMAGTSIVFLALISYSIAIISEQKNRKLNGKILLFFTIGIIFDISATICMIIGSENTPWTLHGIMGYSSLTGMLIDAILLWKLKAAKGISADVPKSLHTYSRYAYIWWVCAFITGGLLVMLK